MWKPVFLRLPCNQLFSTLGNHHLLPPAHTCYSLFKVESFHFAVSGALCSLWQIKYEETAFKDSWAHRLWWLAECSSWVLESSFLEPSLLGVESQQLNLQIPTQQPAPTARPLRRYVWSSPKPSQCCSQCQESTSGSSELGQICCCYLKRFV